MDKLTIENEKSRIWKSFISGRIDSNEYEEKMKEIEKLSSKSMLSNLFSKK